MQHTIFIEKERTSDYQMTRGLREIIERNGNADDLIAFMQDRNLPWMISKPIISLNNFFEKNRNGATSRSRMPCSGGFNMAA